jgi:hypothetical protein
MQNFAGGDTISAVNCRMIKRALFAVLAVTGIGLFTQPTVRADGFDPIFGFYRPELLASADGSDLVGDLPMRQLLDGRVPGSTALGRMGMAPVANFPMTVASTEVRQKASTSGPVKDPKDGKDYSSTESFAAEKASLTWSGGEVGFMYGHASGKFGGDLFSSYLMGGVGNEHMQINVGASYQEFNGHSSRSRP